MKVDISTGVQVLQSDVPCARECVHKSNTEDIATKKRSISTGQVPKHNVERQDQIGRGSGQEPSSLLL